MILPQNHKEHEKIKIEREEWNADNKDITDSH